MKIVTSDFIKSLPLPNQNTVSPFTTMLRDLKLNQSFWIDRDEWKAKTTPVMRIANYSGKYSIDGRKFSGRTYEKGWLITRVG